MSTFTTRVRKEPGAARFAIREVAEDLDVWALRGAPREVADALAVVLNATATDVPAHLVRAALLPFSDLEPLDTPPSAVQSIPAGWVPVTVTLYRRPRTE